MEKMVTTPLGDRNPALVRRRADIRAIRNPRPARDVRPGESWAFTDHRTMAEIMGEGLL
jgi:hypothetical protein